MFRPTSWLKPRLKFFCVAFGSVDLTLIFLSAIGWYFLFDMCYQAQQDHILSEYRSKRIMMVTPSPHPPDEPPHGGIEMFKEDKPEEQLRLERTVRACGLMHGVENDIDQNFAAPASMIGAAMGGYAILASLLISLGVLKHPVGKKVLSVVCLVGEALSTFMLMAGIIYLIANKGLCPTEYYYEFFQPLFTTFVFGLMFITCYKVYEITVIVFYFIEQSKIARRDKRTNDALRKEAKLPPESQASDMKMTNMMASFKIR